MRRAKSEGTLTHDGERFVWKPKGSRYLPQYQPMNNGFTKTIENRRVVWSTTNPEYARMLYRFADTRARAQLGAKHDKIQDPNQRGAILTCLRLLADNDPDYALELNGVGFSKSTAVLGHSLADRQELTPEQAFTGRELCVIHFRQLPVRLAGVAVKGYRKGKPVSLAMN